MRISIETLRQIQNRWQVGERTCVRQCCLSQIKT